MTRFRTRFALPLLLALAAFVLYAVTLVPGVYDGDYGELQYMPRVLGLPHPTGYPLYLLQAWLGSWLPLGSLAWRMNLRSALWGAATVGFLALAAHQVGTRRVATAIGVAAFALTPFFWGYATLAAVYSLNTALMAAALWLWLCWSAAAPRGQPANRKLWLAAFVTGLSLTNHPTAAFLVPAAVLFALLHGPMPWRAALVALLLFALPGVLYAYVPVRLWMIGPGEVRGGLVASISQGLIAPYLDWSGVEVVLRYITGRSLLASYGVEPSLMWTALPATLASQVGWPLLVVGAGGALWLLHGHGRQFALLAALFVPAALYALSYDAGFEARDEIAHLEGHLLPALLVLGLWVAQGAEVLGRALDRLRLPNTATMLLLVLLALPALWLPHRGQPLPTTDARLQSTAIDQYWREVLAYPLPSESALVGHWGDLTPFWYFQQGEGLRPDLWAIFPPATERIDAWLAAGEGPVYLAGPLLTWAPELATRYELAPWGILVRVAPPGSEAPLPLPPQRPRLVEYGVGVNLQGYSWSDLGDGRRQLWLDWRTVAPIPRDLSLSLRLHGPDGVQLFQKDGRLASLWYPEGTLPAGLRFASVFDFTLPPDLPPGSVARLVLYEPSTLAPWLTRDGQDVVALGLVE